jgi:tyrosyl-tRNA synthetase
MTDTMTRIAERTHLITRNLEEVIGADEIPGLLEQAAPLRHYIGLEISGELHLGTGVICMQKVRDLQMAGILCTIFLADWHTWINEKLGGDLDRIRRVAVGYFKEGLKASLAAVGGRPDELRFVLGSDLYHHNDRYWESLVEVAKNTTLNRVMRSISIMGRTEGESIDFAKLLYPPMQVADVFMLEANFPQGGIDQRKAHVIARDVANALTIKPLRDAQGNVIKPIALHHHLLLGLSKPPVWPVAPDQLREMRTQMKMSKSKRESAIFIHDAPDEIRKKIRKAFCPPEVDFNPILDWTEYLVFRNDHSLHVKRTPENGGDVTFDTFDDLKTAYAGGKLHSMDLKDALAQTLIDLLEPVRSHFEQPDIKAMWDELRTML